MQKLKIRKGQTVPTVLIEPNALFREGLKRIFRESNFCVLQAAPSVSALSDWGDSLRVQLCVLGARDPGSIPEQIRRIKSKHDIEHIVVLGRRCEFRDVAAALRAGGSGYLVNTISHEVLLNSLELIMLNEPVVISLDCLSAGDFRAFPFTERGENRDDCAASISGGCSAVTIDPPRIHNQQTAAQRLSPREVAILSCIKKGASNKAIARELTIAEQTVKVHIKAILRKIQVSNRTQAAIWAMRSFGGINSARDAEDAEYRERTSEKQAFG